MKLFIRQVTAPYFFLIYIISFLGCQFSNRSTLVLDDKWKFNIGDSTKFALPNYNDSGWRVIDYTNTFNDLGLNNYNGMAWYRYIFVLPKQKSIGENIKKLVFYLGRIDDYDQVFINGVLVGSNSIDGDTSLITSGSQADVLRKYEISVDSDRLKWGQENLIAIRVFDQFGDGGMSSTPFINFSSLPLKTRYSIDNKWKFYPNDLKNYSAKEFDHSSWKNINLSDIWENQGYSNLDGFGWYRATFNLVKNVHYKSNGNHKINFQLGKIDDNDQVYLNGYLIGENGKNISIKNYQNENFIFHPTLAGTVRNYDLDLSDSRLDWTGENVLAVRVFDSGGGGGIIGKPSYTIDTSACELDVDLSRFYKLNSFNTLDTFAIVYNKGSEKFFGTLKFNASMDHNKKIILTKSIKLELASLDSLRIPVSLPTTTNQTQISFLVEDLFKSIVFYDAYRLPFVLSKR